jgi:hypothetical protein
MYTHYYHDVDGKKPFPVDSFYDVFKVLTIGNMITNNSRRLGVVINTES